MYYITSAYRRTDVSFCAEIQPERPFQSNRWQSYMAIREDCQDVGRRRTGVHWQLQRMEIF